MESNEQQYQLSQLSNPLLNLTSSTSVENTSANSSQLPYLSDQSLDNINPVSHIYRNSIIQDSSETDDHIYLNDDLEIRVKGIPSTGAKSRVETQIKLSIQLASKSSNKTPYWSYLRINESMLAKSKLKKSRQQKLLNGSAAAMVSNESKVLDLEARIVCETDEDKIIKMCHGCVRRERKRAERKKYCKPSSAKINSDVYDKEFERDRQRVLLFNCEPLVNFSTGSAIIPTRITCYCRHHNEKIGFRVRFTVKNYKGIVIATGDTPPIMITDDHKTLKQAAALSMETHRSERHRRAISTDLDDSDFMATPGTSRRNSFSGSEAESDTSPMSTTSFVSECLSTTSSPTTFTNSSCETINTTINTSPQTPNSPNLWKDTTTFENPCGQFQIPEYKVSHSHHYRTTQTLITHPIMLQENEFSEQHVLPSTRRHRRLDNVIMSDSVSPINHYNQQTSKDNLYNQSYHANNTPILSSFTPVYQAQSTAVPILNTITPFEGSSLGGIEVTIEGQGFYPGLTLMFGNRAATTIFSSPASMVCILPPAEQSGTVFVSFKEHPYTKTHDLPTFFSYFEQIKHDLIAFSLQAVGLKNHPYVHYQQSNNGLSAPVSQHVDNNFLSYENQHHQYSIEHSVELKVIQILSDHFYDASVLSQTNMGGQNLLHFAAYYNMDKLIDFLAFRNSNLVNSQDRNGLTPLHFGCQYKSTLAIESLLKLGASMNHMSNIGTAINVVASLLSPLEFQHLEHQVQQGGSITDTEKSNVVDWLPNLFAFAVIQYYQKNNLTTMWPCASIYLEQPIAQENNILF